MPPIRGSSAIMTTAFTVFMSSFMQISLEYHHPPHPLLPIFFLSLFLYLSLIHTIN